MSCLLFTSYKDLYITKLDDHNTEESQSQNYSLSPNSSSCNYPPSPIIFSDHVRSEGIRIESRDEIKEPSENLKESMLDIPSTIHQDGTTTATTGVDTELSDCYAPPSPIHFTDSLFS